MKKLILLLLINFMILLNFPISSIYGHNSGPITAFYLAGDGEVTKYDLDGNLLWNYVTNNRQVLSLYVGPNGNVYFGDENDDFWKLDSEGNLVWRINNFGGSNEKSAIAVDSTGIVYVGDTTGDIHVFDNNGNHIRSFFVDNGNVAGLVVDTNDNLIAGVDDSRGIYKYDSNGNLLWSYHTSVDNPRNIHVDSNNDIYVGDRRGYVYKISSSGNQIWFEDLRSLGDVDSIAVNQNGLVTAVSRNGFYTRFDFNGNVVNTVDLGIRPFSVVTDYDSNLYIQFAGGPPSEIRKYDSSDNLVWTSSWTSELAWASSVDTYLPLTSQEPDFYDISIQSNTPYVDFIYQDNDLNIITDHAISVIDNDEPFNVTSSTVDFGSFEFDGWYNLSGFSIYSNNFEIDVNDPFESLDIIGVFNLVDFNTFNINDNLPFPISFTLNTTTNENQSLSLEFESFNNYDFPNDRNWEIIAPINNIGVYEFDYFYNNDQNDIYSFSNVITGSNISVPNLTAVYSLPEEFQINLLIESSIGNLIFQHGDNEPISGPFISQTIGLGDDWTVTAPDNPDFGFNYWDDLLNYLIFSENQTLNITNTNQDYYLEAKYFPLVEITWDSNGGTLIPSQKIRLGNEINAPNDPKRPNFVFDGWLDSGGNPVEFPIVINQDTTFTAKWLDVFTLTYDTNGGGRINPDTYIEQQIPNVVTPSRFGYTFEGWFTDDGTFQNEYNFTNPINQDTTIHAKWAFGSDRDAELSLTTFLNDNDLGDRFSQIIVMITIYVFVNIVIMIYQAPLVVTLILNFIVTSLFMILGWIAIWLVVVIFMALFGFLYFTSSGRGLTE